jgi:paraquat-inducible protein A
MKNKFERKQVALVILLASLLFFILGFLYPILQTGFQIGPFTLKKEFVYLGSSFNYFFNNGEVFIGIILLLFTIIFPAFKFIFLILTISGKKINPHPSLILVLEIINKWAMLDVFVVAVLILNMKFDSKIIISKLEIGITLFAISVVLMMTAGFIMGKMKTQGQKI